MKLITAFFFSLAAIVAVNTAHARGDAEAGKTKAAACQACHGADGLGTNPQYPKLAGQRAGYLVYALEAYQSGERKNPIMAGFAGTLTDQDREDLAAYYSSLPSGVTSLTFD